REDMLDFPTTSDESPFKHAHLHTWQNDEKFSKFEFMRGAYANVNRSNLSIHHISDYAMLMALTSIPTDKASDTNSPFVRAALIYLPPDQPRFIHELRWFKRSWIEMQKHEPSTWRTDIIIFTDGDIPELKELNCEITTRTSITQPNKCIVVPGYKTLKSTGFSYAFGDSINVAAVNHPTMEIYDWVLRTDIDTFLTPAFATWKPSTMAVGYGQYAFAGHNTSTRLDRIMTDLNMSIATVHNIGSTWYGPRISIQACAELTVDMMRYLDAYEFTDEEKSEEYGITGWPEWHHGVLSLYAGHIAINHCTKESGVRKRADMLDFPSDSTDSPMNHAHIHCWQKRSNFSKSLFMEGKYSINDLPSLHPQESIRDYAMFMALDSHKAPGLLPTPSVSTSNVDFVRGVVTHLPRALSVGQKVEFRTFHRSWREVMAYEPKTWRTDLVVYAHQADSDFFDSLNCSTSNKRQSKDDPALCVVITSFTSLQATGILIEGLDQTNVIAETASLLHYDWILKSAPDAILTRTFATWKPDLFTVASGNYILDGRGTGARLNKIATSLQLESHDISNIGATWYGPGKVMQECAKLAVAVSKHLYENEFTAEEKSPQYGIKGWPEWHFGVLQLYANQIALNHCTKDSKMVINVEMLEAPSSLTDSPNNHAHLHTWKSDSVFDKRAFQEGKYYKTPLESLDIAQNTSAYALYMALDAHDSPNIMPTPYLPPTAEVSRDLDKSFVRAAVVYLPPKIPKFINELRWFRRSWIEMQKYEPSLWRTDIVIYTSEMTPELTSLNCTETHRTSRTDPNQCIVVTNFTSMRTKEFDYGFADSLKVVAMDNIVVQQYDYLLRTDLDTFLTPAFSTWKPDTVIVGQGAYMFDGTTTAQRLASIIEKLNYTKATVNNVGSTWYGPTKVLQECGNLTVKTIMYLHHNEFTDEEKSPDYGIKGWPNWHWGVLTMYAGHIAINHCTRDVGVEKRSDMLDFPSTSKESPKKHAHIHTWQNGERFSKFSFADGKYAKENISELNLDKIQDYAMYMALDSHKEPGLLPGAPIPRTTDPPRDINKDFTRAIVLHVPSMTPEAQLELRTFHRSWREVVAHEPTNWRTDLVIFTTEMDALLSSLDCTKIKRTAKEGMSRCIVVNGYPSASSNKYPIDIEGFNVVAQMKSNYQYDWLLKSSPDAILTRAFATWKPATMVVAPGSYIVEDETRDRLEGITKKLHLNSNGISNVGGTWYGPATQLESCAELAIVAAKHLYSKEFTDKEKSPEYGNDGWPKWHLGVLSSYAGEIALKHCAKKDDIAIRSDMLEASSSLTDSPIYHAHLHTWHNRKMFNKADFAAGKYRETSLESLEASKESNTSAYALYIALDAQKQARQLTQEQSKQEITSQLTRAAVLYFPSEIQGRFVGQLRWFMKSWQTMQPYEPSQWRTDILIYTDEPLDLFTQLNCTSQPRLTPDEPNKCIFISTYSSIKSNDFDYGYADSVNVVATNSQELDAYDYLLRTDIDTFLTPAFAKWQPEKLIVGQGNYLGSTTALRLEKISAKLGWRTPTLQNIGSTWYGPAAVLRKCAKLTMEAMMYLHKNSFTDLEKSSEYGIQGWPEWHYGVLTLYAGHLAINECTNDVEKRTDMLDFPTTSLESPFLHAHLHTWQNNNRFSKFAFDEGKYANVPLNSLEPLENIADYAIMTSVRVVIVPVLNDNYAYLLIDQATATAAAIDPVEPQKVLAAAQEHGVSISHVLTTHCHADHDGGNFAMRSLLPTVEIIGGKNDNVKAVTREVDHDDEIAVGELKVRVLSTPCHTPGHVLYLCDGKLFTGDTLFVAGCGRFFSGTADQMHFALNTVVAGLPPATEIYCGHEYTVNNLAFAADVEPENELIKKKQAWANEVKTTIPSTVASELETNPFMRVHVAQVQQFTKSTDPVEVMARLREFKNSFGLGQGKK
ncbi:hydroxyacylglutathione hydrolase, mitochondrial-like isoform X2, partial [Thraustotheca clavata]